MLCIVVNALFGADKVAGQAQWRARVQIAIELGKSAGRDLHTYAMPGLEDLTGIPAIYTVLIHLTRFDRRGMFHAVAEARAYHAIAQALAEAVGPDIDEHGHEISVGCGRRCVEIHDDPARRLRIS